MIMMQMFLWGFRFAYEGDYPSCALNFRDNLLADLIYLFDISESMLLQSFNRQPFPDIQGPKDDMVDT